MRIGLDLDGVVYHWDRIARYMLRRRYEATGRAVPLELYSESMTWYWIKDYVESEDWAWLWAEGPKLGLFRYGHVVKGAVDGARLLAELGNVVVVTARPKVAAHDTLAWLSFMLDKVPLAGIHILGDEPKSSVRPLPDIYIEDSPDQVSDLVNNTGSEVVVFDRPFNRDVPSVARIHRARGWGEVVQVVRELVG